MAQPTRFEKRCAKTITPPVLPDRRWKTLEKEGVKRCCAIFTGGKQCTRRAEDGSWCKKHGKVIKRVTSQFDHLPEITGNYSTESE